MKKFALISVFDKENIEKFAKELIDLGYEIISTSGTYKFLKDKKINVIDVNEITNFNEILNGRVKTLHPFIHGAILYRRNKKEDIETIKNLNISSIDIVVNNLYPFEKVLNDKNKTHDDLIENIDIGGPSMIRAAAKNYKDVLVVVDKNDYKEVIERLKIKKIDEDFRLSLARKAFCHTAYYDSLISNYFNDLLNVEFPENLTISYKKINSLRYGENPHQRACAYKKAYIREKNKFDFKKIHGKELSYNNLTDIYASIKMIKEFKEPAVVCLKHASPCGIAVSKDINEAFDKAYECDNISIFGGVIALNEEVSEYIAKKINSFFLEIVIARKFSKKALEILQKKKNIRLIEIENIKDVEIENKTLKEDINGILYQDYDNKLLVSDLEFVTKTKPTKDQLEQLIFAFKASKFVLSNGVVIVKDNATIGIGQGECRRSFAVKEAIERAKGKLEGSVLASDGFFFEDTVEMLKENKIKAVISPGGSIKDKDVIKLCDEYSIAMVFTKTRHFRH